MATTQTEPVEDQAEEEIAVSAEKEQQAEVEVPEETKELA